MVDKVKDIITRSGYYYHGLWFISAWFLLNRKDRMLVMAWFVNYFLPYHTILNDTVIPWLLWQYSETCLYWTSYVFVTDRCVVYTSYFNKISYIVTLSKVRFIQVFGLFSVRFRQFWLYIQFFQTIYSILDLLQCFS